MHRIFFEAYHTGQLVRETSLQSANLGYQEIVAPEIERNQSYIDSMIPSHCEFKNKICFLVREVIAFCESSLTPPMIL